MGVFFLLLLAPMIMQHVAVRGVHSNYQKRNKNALACFFLLLTLLVMLRHETVGTDTSNYINIFRKYSKLEWNWRDKNTLSEPGFFLFAKAIAQITDHPQVFFAISAMVTSAMIYPTYKRLCMDATLTIILYCIMSTFVMMFSGIRQMQAIGIGVVAFEYAREKKLVPFILATLLAMSFHNSAFILAFIYPLYHAKITKKWLYLVVPAMAVVFVFNRPIFSVLCNILERYTRFSGTVSSTGAYAMLFLFAMFVVFAYLIPDESRMDKDTIGLRNLLLLSLVIQMFAPLHLWAMRMNYYYIIFIPLLLPRIIHYRSKRWNQVAILGRSIMIVGFLVYFFMNAYGGESLDVFPYHFFWEKLT